MVTHRLEKLLLVTALMSASLLTTLPAKAANETVTPAAASSSSQTTAKATDPFETGADTGLKQKAVQIKPVKNLSSTDIRGVDISSYEALKNASVKYYDFNGKQVSLLKVLHENGVNYLRLRIWNNPTNAQGKTYGGGEATEANELAIAKEASKYGMKVLIDFHYSDFWADPAQQIRPKAWKNDTYAQLKKHVASYTTSVLKDFKAAGVNVGMVQVGNEITNGLLGYTVDRDTGGSWTQVWDNAKTATKVTGLLQAGSQAVKKTDPKALVVMHLETPDVGKYDRIMTVLKQHKVNYDVLGSSYYPYWGNTTSGLNAVQKMVGSKYGKLFAVMETAWTSTLKDADGTPNSIGDSANVKAYPVGPQGQVDEMRAMYETVKSHANGLGGFYWEPAWIPVHAGWDNWKINKEVAETDGTGWASSGALGYFPNTKMYYNGQPAWGGSSWDNQALFDDRGYPLQSLKMYKYLVGSRQQQTTRFVFVNATTGEELQPAKYQTTTVGKFVQVKYPAIKGYRRAQTSYHKRAMTNGLKTITVKYRPWFTSKASHHYVTVTNSHYRIWRNFKWTRKSTTAKQLHQTFYMKRDYRYSVNNSHFVSLWSQGKFYGYVSRKAVTVAKGKQGVSYSTHQVKQVNSRNYSLYRNFKWQHKQSSKKFYHQKVLVKRYYQHYNGQKYAAVYRQNGKKFLGYLNAKALK